MKEELEKRDNKIIELFNQIRLLEEDKEQLEKILQDADQGLNLKQ